MTDRQFELLIHDVAHRDRNLKGIAALMGLPYSTLAEQVNPNNDKKFHAGLLPRFIEAADDNRLIEYLCSLRGLAAVKVPDPEGTPHREWLRHIAAVMREAGEAVTALADALADGVITKAEFKRCLKEVDEAVQELMSLRAALIDSIED